MATFVLFTNIKLNQTQAIALYQPTLQTIAYNFLRCKADAEDIVQDTLLKWLTVDTTKIENTKAYLIKAVTNNCINHLNTLKKKKEEYWDNIQFSQLILKWKESDLAHFDFEKELSGAFKVIHTKLEPLERAAFLLKEVFDFDYKSLQEVLNKKSDHCRQLLSRARKKLSDESTPEKKTSAGLTNLFNSFKEACELGNATEFIKHLKKEISEG